jgi:hypothetical protein
MNARRVPYEAPKERSRVCFGGFRAPSLKLWSVGDPTKHVEESWALAHGAPLFAKYHGKTGASTKKVFLEVEETLTSLTLVGTIIDPFQITSFLFLLPFLNLLIIFLVYRG